MRGAWALSGRERSSAGGFEASEAPAERVDVGAQGGGGFDEAGVGLLVVGWVATAATLIVTTSDAVILMQGRRRTYEPLAVLERVERSARCVRIR